MKPDSSADAKIDGLKNLLRGLERPFILKDLSPQLKEFTKKELETAITALVASKDLIMKTNGSMKIYYYNYKSAGAQALVRSLFFMIEGGFIEILTDGRERGT